MPASLPTCWTGQRNNVGWISTATADVIQRLWGDLPAGDLATAGRVLAIITGRANAELAR